jgi:hypothetical protein
VEKNRLQAIRNQKAGNVFRVFRCKVGPLHPHVNYLQHTLTFAKNAGELGGMIAEHLRITYEKTGTRQDAVCSLRDAGAPRLEGNDC